MAALLRSGLTCQRRQKPRLGVGWTGTIDARLWNRTHQSPMQAADPVLLRIEGQRPTLSITAEGHHGMRLPGGKDVELSAPEARSAIPVRKDWMCHSRSMKQS